RPPDRRLADSLAQDPVGAYARGIETARNRPTDALPFLRAAAEASPSRWDFQAVYATALNNASFEQTSRRGLPAPRGRASWEGTRLALESQSRFTTAERLVTKDGDRERVER